MHPTPFHFQFSGSMQIRGLTRGAIESSGRWLTLCSNSSIRCKVPLSPTCVPQFRNSVVKKATWSTRYRALRLSDNLPREKNQSQPFRTRILPGKDGQETRVAGLLIVSDATYRKKNMPLAWIVRYGCLLYYTVIT